MNSLHDTASGYRIYSKKNCTGIKYWFIYTKTKLKNDVKVTEV